MPTSRRLRRDIGNGLDLCQSRSHWLLGEEVVVLQLRGAWVVFFSRCFEGDQGRRVVLCDLCSVGSWERGEDNSDPRGAGVWGCIPMRGIRLVFEKRSGVLHRSCTRSGSSVDSSLPHGSDGVGGVEKTNKGVDWETIYTA